MNNEHFHGRREDRALLTGQGTFIDGLTIPELDGALHGFFVRSIEAHATISNVDITDALAAPGVAAVYLGGDLDAWPLPPRLPSMNREMWRPMLALETVRFVGEPIAFVLAETRAAAVDAAELVIVDYQPLPVVLDLEESLSDELVLHPAASTNVSLAWAQDPVDEEDWAACDVIDEFVLRHPRLNPAPIEPLAGASTWIDGRCIAWVCSQRPAGAKHVIEMSLGLEPGTVRAIAPDVGGGFGAKGGWGCYPEDVVSAWAARAIGRPVRWAQSRSEASVAMGHGRASSHRVKIGGDRDGTIKAYEVEALQDSGAYPAMGTNITNNLKNSGTGVYDIAAASVRGTSVVTNTTPTVAFRGAGRPEAACDIERAVDRFARAIEMDPAEVRRRNVVAADAFPYTTAVGATYDSGNYGEALRRALAAAGYDEIRAEQAQRRADGVGRQLGIGVTCTTEITGGGEGERATASIDEDGTIVIVVGTKPHGQGHETTFAAVAAEQLGVPADLISIKHSDTDLAPRGGGTTGSRSAQLGGSAVYGAAVEMLELARQRTADLLEANVVDIVVDPQSGALHVLGSPAVSLSWDELGPIEVEHRFKPEGGAGTFSFGACVAVVEVDVETGEVELRSIVSVDDAGTLLQPVLADGQVHGGIGLAVGAALYEEMAYDGNGTPLTVNFADYGIPSAAELISFDCHEMETPSPLNPLGVKGLGESGTVVATPAIHGAVLDALAPLGVDHLDLPLGAQRVWQAIDRSVSEGSGRRQP